MATKTRIRRKELRQPDEFVTLTARAVAYTRAHAQAASWAGAGVVAVVLAVVAMASFRSIQAERANLELSRALSVLRSGKHTEAFTLLGELAQRRAAPALAPVARLYAGRAALAAGNLEEAIRSFEDAAAKLGTDYLRQQALIGLAYAMETKNDHAEAAKRFGDAAALSGPLRSTAALGRARNQEKTGDAAAAKEAYARFLADFPDAPEKRLVEAHVASYTQ